MTVTSGTDSALNLDGVSEMGKAAVSYAQMGWRVIPIWHITDIPYQTDLSKFECGCETPNCKNAGKHPHINLGQGVVNASSDVGVVLGWWSQWPDANIAVATGADTGIVVIDLDIEVEHTDKDGHLVHECDGEMELLSWAAGQNFDVPPTLTAVTGGGGKHLVFRSPSDGGPAIRNAVGWLPSVDVRGEGGYILVAPSKHESGRHYEWLPDVDGVVGFALQPAEMHPLLTSALRMAKSRTGKRSRQADESYRPDDWFKEAKRTYPKHGQRDDFFNAYAFQLRMNWAEYLEAVDIIREVWERMPQPDDDEYSWETAEEKISRAWAQNDPGPKPERDIPIIDWVPGKHVEAGSEQEEENNFPVYKKPLIRKSNSPDKKRTDKGNAHRFVEIHQATVRHCTKIGWFVWSGRNWVPDPREMPISEAHEVSDSLFADVEDMGAGEERDDTYKWALASESTARLKAMCTQAQDMEPITCDQSSFDPDPWLMNVANGVVDLRNGILMPHSSHLMMTHISGVSYEPDAADPRWSAYLWSVTGGDEDLIGYLRRAVGYTLTALTREEKFFMLYGPKASGKSTFLDAMQTILGELAMMVQPDTLQQRRNGDKDEYEIASMIGKRMLACVELPENGRLNEALIKQMTGGDRMAGRQIYSKRSEFAPVFKLWIGTNHSPKALDEAIWRRLKRVPLPRSIPVEEQDTSIKEDVKNPESLLARTVLAWAVRGCLEWQRDGLGTCAIVEADTAAYQAQQDKFGRFLEDRCVVNPDSQVGIKELYECYALWANSQGEGVMSMSTFASKLIDRGFPRIKNARPVSHQGLRLDPALATPGLSWTGR